MSVRIHWRQTSDQGKAFSGGTSTSLDILQGMGNILGQDKIPVLRGMGKLDKFYDEVADAIESVGEIEVWGVW